MTHAQDQIDLIADIQTECLDVAPQTARLILRANFPQKTDSFFKRNLPLILSMDPEELVPMLGYPDPTGETAVRNVMAARP